MADIFDVASEYEEKARAAALQCAREKKPSMLPKGVCYNCLESVACGDLFCDEDCRDDWQYRNPNK